MNWQSFLSIIQQPSDATFFISNVRQTESLGKTLCALLNTNGGTLVVGYDKINVHLTGYDESDEWINEFIEANFHGTLSITSAFLFRANKKVLLLDVLKANTPQSFNGVFYQIINKSIEEYTPHAQQPIINPPIQQPMINQPTEPAVITAPTQPLPTIEKTSELLDTQDPVPTVSSILEDIDAITASPEITENTLTEFNDRQRSAIDYVKQQGSIKNKQYRKLFNVSHKTAHIELAELVQKKQFKISGSGRSTCYKHIDAEVETESIQQNTVLDSFLATQSQITAAMYADEFNIDLAQAINELETLCNQGSLEKKLINNESFYVKATQLSFI